MTLFKEDVYGNEIRPIIKPVEKFLDSHILLDSKLEPMRDRRISRRVNPLFDEDVRIDFLLGLLQNRVHNRENLRSTVRSSK